MKKLLIGIIVLGLVAVGGWLYWNQQKAEQQKMADRFYPSPAQLYSGIADQVSPVFEVHGYKIAMLVPGDRIEDDSWVFRGTARSGNLSPAYYGQIDYVCSVQEKTTDQCWKLSQLVVDGRPLEFAAMDGASATGGADAQKEMETRESEALGMTNALDTADGDRKAVAPETYTTDDAATMPGNTAATDVSGVTAREPETAPSPENTTAANAADAPSGDVWRTTSGNVNARMGPGTDFEVAFAMPETTPLHLIEQKNGWGHFSYIGPDGKTYRVWIYMTLVAKD